MKFSLNLKSRARAAFALASTILCASFLTCVFSAAPVAADEPRVIASFSVSSVDGLWNGGERGADAMKYGDLVKGIRGLFNARVKSDLLDPAKPLGVIVATNGDEVAAFGYRPLLKPEEFDEAALAGLKEKLLEIDQNLFQSAEFFVANGALIVGKESQKNLISSVPADAFAVPSGDAETLVGVQINFEALPQEFVEAGSAVLRQKLAEMVGDENDDELLSVDRALANYSELVSSLKSIQWTLAADADSNLVSDFVLTAKPETDLAESLAKTAQTPTRWRAIADTPNAIAISIDAGDCSTTSFKVDAEHLRRAIHKNLEEMFDVLKDDPETLEFAKEIAEHVENAIVADIPSETYDSGFAISAEPLALVFGSNCAAPNELQTALEKLVERLRETESVAIGEVAKEEIGGYSVLGSTIPLDGVSDEIPFFKGKSVGVKIGFSKDAVLVVAALDPDSANATFERVATGSKETGPQTGESFFDASELAKAIQSVLATRDDVRPQAMKSIEAFVKAEDARIVSVQSYEGGVLQVKTTVRRGFFAPLGDVLRINLMGGGNGDEGQDIDDIFDDEE